MSETTAAIPQRDSPPSLELLDHLVQEVETVFHGKKEVVRLAVAALLARGHILFEDIQFGTAGDVPHLGDVTGDGIDELIIEPVFTSVASHVIPAS